MAFIGKIPAAAALTSSDLADDIITLAKMAGGTDGNIITYDASGDPAVVAAGTSGHFLKSQGAGSVPVFAAASSDVVKLAATSVSGATTGSLDGYFTSDYNRYEVVVPDFVTAGTSSDIWFRTRSSDSTNSGSYYVNWNGQMHTDITPTQLIQATNSSSNDWDSPTTYWKSNATNMGDDAKAVVHFTIYDPLNSSHWKQMKYSTYTTGFQTENMSACFGWGVYKANTALSGVEIISSSDNWSGTMYLYGYK